MFFDNTVLGLTLHTLQNRSIKYFNLRKNIFLNLRCLWVTWQFNKVQTFNEQLQSEGSCVLWFKKCGRIVAKKIFLGKKDSFMTAYSWRILGLVQMVCLAMKASPLFQTHKQTHTHTHYL